MDEPKEAAPEEQPFLASEPPPLVARGLVILILSIVAVGAVLSVVIKFPESVSADFVLVPQRGADPIRAPRNGRVKEVAIAESARVTEGRVLVILQSIDEADRNAELRTAGAREQSGQEGLANARQRNAIAARAAAEEMARLVERQAYLERVEKLKQVQLTLTVEQAERTVKLNEEGLLSQDDKADARIRRAQAELELEQLQADLRETRNAIQKQRLAQQAQAAAFHEEERLLLDKLAEAQIQREAKSGEAVGNVAGEISIAAPCEGTMLRLAVRAAGTVVREGDTLAEIACLGERLQAELTLPQEAMSRIQPGQTVKLLYDAFPYQHYGVKEALVRWTSPAAATGTSRLEFRAFAELKERSILVDGQERPLLPGMRGKARILVGRRSVISYIFGPLRQLEEAVR